MSSPLSSLRSWFLDPIPVDAAIAFSPGSICAARVQGRRGSRALRALAIEPLPEDALIPTLDHPGFRNADALRDALKRALNRAEIEAGSKVAVALPDALVRFRVFGTEETKVAAGDRDSMLRFRLQKLLPFEAHETRVVAAWPGSPGVGPLGAGAAAAVVDAYEQALRGSSLDPGFVEPSLSILMRSAASLGPDGDVIVVNADPSCLAIGVLRNGWPISVRTFGVEVARVPQEIDREIAATVVFWRDRLQGSKARFALVHGVEPVIGFVARSVQRAFETEVRRAGLPQGMGGAGLSSSQIQTAAVALASLAESGRS